MSGWVCYLGRTDRGDRLSQVRLVGVGPEQVWEGASAADDPAGVMEQAANAAGWVAERAGRGSGGGEISLLCLDVDGSSCAWLTAPSADPAVVAAAIAQGGEGAGEGGGASGGPWAPASVSEASVQALAAPVAVENRSLLPTGRKGKPVDAGGQRLAVLAVPDVLARVFVDDLDDRGIAVERAVSLWHGMAMAWDPAGPAAGGSVRGGSVVATSAALSAVVLIDPDAARMVWCWSLQGELLAAGTIRLMAERQEGQPAVRITGADVARLTTDWLAWSIQLGRSPQRVVCIGPDTAGEAADAMTPAALGTAIGRAWPGATVDLAVHDDPVGATLARLAGAPAPAGAPADPRVTLVSLSRRPGRMHRSMYRWVSLAGFAAAAALLGVGWKAWETTNRARTARTEARATMVETATTLAPPGMNASFVNMASDAPRRYLEDQLRVKRQSLDPTGGLDPVKPIMAELETLSFVLGTPEIQIEQISLLASGVVLNLWVPDTLTGETIKAGLDGVSNSNVEWGPPTFGSGRSKPGMQSLAIYGTWKATGARPAAPAGGQP